MVVAFEEAWPLANVVSYAQAAASSARHRRAAFETRARLEQRPGGLKAFYDSLSLVPR
jgi:hypothetical protein